jgi:CHAT domain-containing protein
MYIDGSLNGITVASCWSQEVSWRCSPCTPPVWKQGNRTHRFIDDIEVTYTPSVWILDRCHKRLRPDWAPVLVIGNPSTKDRVPLPFSLWEATEIAGLLDTGTGPQTASLRIGVEATLEEVHKLLRRHPTAHFSCHGSWDALSPLNSCVLLAGTGKLTLGELLTRRDLDKSRMVVLSSCDTGSGHDPRTTGQEYLGLPAGFMVAGTPTVVGSLWPVPDLSTALLMTEMYRGLLLKMEVPQALREAQLWLRGLTRDEAFQAVAGPLGKTPLGTSTEEYRHWLTAQEDHPFQHPYYWAAFEVLGSPRALIDP